MKSARDRKTSAVIVHFTRLVRASMKHGKTSCENVSDFKASKNLFTIPILKLGSVADGCRVAYAFGIISLN